jgi:putative flavoprotein involved in K+ transport
LAEFKTSNKALKTLPKEWRKTMNGVNKQQYFDTVVIGGGQAGLAMGYHLRKQGQKFVILEAYSRIGTSWRRRWDSLRLFTPAWISSLPGMPHKGSDNAFLTKDEVADYLESYAAHFNLPVQLNSAVSTLSRQGDTYLLAVGDQQLSTRQVVVATGTYQQPRIPAFASELASTIFQIHSDAYHNPNQLQNGNLLVVGAGSSGAEIALELVSSRRVWLAGRDTGHRPKNIPPLFRQPYWWLLHEATNTDTKPGRRMREQMEKGGAPLIGISKKAFEKAGVERTPRMIGVRNGKPLLQDGRVLDVANVIWCTGFTPNYSWVKLPIFNQEGHPIHTRGVVESEPGLYFLGLPFQYTLTSTFIGGVGRDADYIAQQIAHRSSASARRPNLVASLI